MTDDLQARRIAAATRTVVKNWPQFTVKEAGSLVKFVLAEADAVTAEADQRQNASGRPREAR